MRGHKFILFSHHQFNTRLRYVHKFYEFWITLELRL